MIDYWDPKSREIDHSDSSDWAYEFRADSADELEMQAREAAERFRQMPELKQENWQQLDAGQRLATLQTVEKQMAEIQGRPAMPVSSVEMSSNTFGQYNGSEIQVNGWTLSDSAMHATEFLDTVIHEGRHAYQDYAIQHPGVEGDPDLVHSWTENFQPGNYLTPEEFGQELYVRQPVEADAWSYAARMIEEFQKE